MCFLDRLETANRQIASQELEGQDGGHLYLSQSEILLLFEHHYTNMLGLFVVQNICLAAQPKLTLASLP